MQSSSKWSPILFAFAIVAGVLAGTTPAAATEATGSIAGDVTGPDGAAFGPDEHVTVELVRRSWNTKVVASVDVAADGTFKLDGLSGEYLVRFRYIGDRQILDEWWGDAYRSSSTEPVVIDPAAIKELDVRLELGGSVSGSLSGSDGPVPWASIWVYPWHDESFGRPDISFVDGRYAVTSLPPGDYGILFAPGGPWYHVDHNGVSTTGHAISEPRLRVGLGESLNRDIVAQRMASISGTVSVDRDGEVGPIGGTRVYAMKPRPDGTFEFVSPSVLTDDQGRFELSGVLPGEYVLGFDDPKDARVFEQFWGGAQTPAEATRVVIEASETVSGIDAVLQSAARVRGRVEYRSPNGNRTPLPATQVVVWRVDDQTGEYVLVPDAAPPAGTDAGFLSEQLVPGRYALYFHHDDYDEVGGEYYQDARYFVERTDVTLRPGETLDLGTVVLDERFFDVGRISGADRYATAVAISESMVPDGASVPVVYVASGVDYPDALAAVPAASTRSGVMLLVPPDHLPGVVADELRRIRPEKIVVVGGEAAVGSTLFASLRGYVDDPSDLSRIGGKTRYETANAIVRDAFSERTVTQAFIATGQSFPDALAAGAAAGNIEAPVLLVDGSTSTIPEATRALLAELDVDHVYIVGGPGAVDPGIEHALGDMLGGAGHVTRLGGVDRYETATIINREFVEGSDYALVSAGTGFADALAGGPLAASLGAPLYLTPSHCIPSVVAADIVDQAVAGILLLGGTGVLSQDLEALPVC